MWNAHIADDGKATVWNFISFYLLMACMMNELNFVLVIIGMFRYQYWGSGGVLCWRESEVQMNMLYDTTRYLEIQRNILRYHEIPRDTLQFHKIPWDIQDILFEISRNTLRYHEIPCDSTRYLDISKIFSLRYHKMPWDIQGTVRCLEISQDNLVYHEIPWDNKDTVFKIQRGALRYPNIPRDTLRYPRFSLWDTTRHLGRCRNIPWDTTGYHKIPLNTTRHLLSYSSDHRPLHNAP